MSHAPDLSCLLAEAQRCPVEHRRAWAATHLESPTLALIEALKTASDEALFTAPATSEVASSLALLLAERMDDEPLGGPLAAWARGSWETFHGSPHAGLRWYESALPAFRTQGDPLRVARLLGNMVSAYTDTAHYAEADHAYAEARTLLLAELSHPATHARALDGLQMLEENYGWMLHEQGRYEEALEGHGRALELAQQLGQPEIVVEVQNNRTMTLGMLGRMAEAEQQLWALRQQAAEHQQAVTVARIDMNLGEIARALGHPAQALLQLQSAEQQFAALHSTVDLGTVWLYHARLFERVGALPAAIRSYRQARDWFRVRTMKAYEGSALFWGAVANRRYGEYERAQALLDECAARWHEVGNDEWRSRVQLERIELALVWRDAPMSVASLLQTPPPRLDIPELHAHFLLVQASADVLAIETGSHPDQVHALEQARHNATHALQLARQIQNRWLERQAWLVRGRVELAAGFSEDAWPALEAAAACDERIRRMLSEEELKARFQMDTSDVFALLVRVAATHQTPHQTLHAVWRAKGSALLDLLTESQARQIARQEATGAEATIQQDIAQVRQQLASYRLQEAQAESPDATHRQTIEGLEQRLYDLRRQRLQRTVPDTNTDTILDRTAPHRLDQMTTWEGDILIEYLRCDDDLLAVRVDKGGEVRVVWLEGTAWRRPLRKLHRIFENVVLSPELRLTHHDAWRSECLPILRQGFATLIAPLGPFPPNARLLIAPCAPLYAVPFAALWDGQHYLVEHHEIEFTPCGGLLLVPPPVASPAPPLIIAHTQDGLFPSNRIQAETIQPMVAGSTCLIDDPTDYQQLCALESAPVVLHIAAHNVERGTGDSPNPAPMLTALQLAGGLFPVEHSFDLPLAGTELVTLGGCTTGGGLDTGGSVLAFPSACFVAGARRVVASAWTVHERDALVWMAHFYRFLCEMRQATGQWHPAAAVRQTQLALLRDPQTDHPAVWANFACLRR